MTNVETIIRVTEENIKFQEKLARETRRDLVRLRRLLEARKAGGHRSRRWTGTAR